MGPPGSIQMPLSDAGSNLCPACNPPACRIRSRGTLRLPVELAKKRGHIGPQRLGPRQADCRHALPEEPKTGTVRLVAERLKPRHVPAAGALGENISEPHGRFSLRDLIEPDAWCDDLHYRRSASWGRVACGGQAAVGSGPRSLLPPGFLRRSGAPPTRFILRRSMPPDDENRC